MKIKFKNPFGDGHDTLTKTVSPARKTFEQYPDGGFRYTFTACGGATFCFERSHSGTCSLKFSEYPDDPWDWNPVEFEVIP